MRTFPLVQPIALIISLLVPCLAPTAQATSSLNACIDWIAEPTLQELATVPLKHADPAVLIHPVEKRDFVTVPLDYSRPSGPKLKIFYRFIPVVGGSVSDTSKPVVVVINGGPGAPSSAYRKYDFDYSGTVPAKADYLGELTKYFRVLIIDQRGTGGNSSALDLNNSATRPEIIARYFDSRHIALDHQEVINTVIAKETFTMIAQSFGGYVGMHYMSLPEITRLPSHICFSSAGMPHSDSLKIMTARRQKQKELNDHLGSNFPQVVQKIHTARAHFVSQGLAAENVNFLWHFLGQGEDGVWEVKLATELDSLITKDKKALQKWISDEGASNFLNYVLSSPILTPGFTDATIATKTSALIPYAHNWMLDENWMLQQVGRDGTWRERMLEAMDINPPPPVVFGSIPEIRRGLSRSRVLFSLALGDVYLPLEVVRVSATPYYIDGVTVKWCCPAGTKLSSFRKGLVRFTNGASGKSARYELTIQFQ